MNLLILINISLISLITFINKIYLINDEKNRIIIAEKYKKQK